MHLSQNELLASHDWNRRTPFAPGIFAGSPDLFAPGILRAGPPRLYSFRKLIQRLRSGPDHHRDMMVNVKTHILCSFIMVSSFLKLWQRVAYTPTSNQGKASFPITIS